MASDDTFPMIAAVALPSSEASADEQTFTFTPEPPPPGSDAAVALGCTCPVWDNARGLGIPRHDGPPFYWIADGCPVHAPESP